MFAPRVLAFDLLLLGTKIAVSSFCALAETWPSIMSVVGAVRSQVYTSVILKAHQLVKSGMLPRALAARLQRWVSMICILKCFSSVSRRWIPREVQQLDVLGFARRLAGDAVKAGANAGQIQNHSFVASRADCNWNAAVIFDCGKALQMVLSDQPWDEVEKQILNKYFSGFLEDGSGGSSLGAALSCAGLVGGSVQTFLDGEEGEKIMRGASALSEKISKILSSSTAENVKKTAAWAMLELCRGDKDNVMRIAAAVWREGVDPLT